MRWERGITIFNLIFISCLRFFELQIKRQKYINKKAYQDLLISKLSFKKKQNQKNKTQQIRTKTQTNGQREILANFKAAAFCAQDDHYRANLSYLQWER